MFFSYVRVPEGERWNVPLIVDYVVIGPMAVLLPVGFLVAIL